ncbi:hypothetical protein SBF1_50101 [Candidatus Desulfosporosinus infrequens]|uniref:Uncharacterized protein n=1 Tax=Candidatus Desulfosporosinus infrequens TaxID=2043169 RepID=A0A2U3LGY5_9FIRM|nr:hypothetical protein SBF1_50101 [Candidatus Desulfosporosinus infrequens]
MDITKIQKIVRKAIKDYAITAKYDEEILVSFLSVDIFREINEDSPAPLSDPKAPPRRNTNQNALGLVNHEAGETP